MALAAGTRVQNYEILQHIGSGCMGDPESKFVGRDGLVQPLPAPPRPYISPRLSPDGKTLAVATEKVKFTILLYNFAEDSTASQLLLRMECGDHEQNR